jgi:exopolyphosphatase/guanosine-5'-triphosphate,3'-diphosphate pyrophosphatase
LIYIEECKMRVAVIDIGTNSTRLLIADVENQSGVRALHTALVTTRLGEGIGQARLLSPAIDRTLAAVEDYLTIISRWQVERIIAVATSAVRDAVNREDFLTVAHRRTGLQVKILSGEEEAGYSYRGVLSGLAVNRRRTVVMDLGGGSTEFTWLRGGRICCRSVGVGAVRVTEGSFSDDWILSLLSCVLDEVREVSPMILIGVGGTVTTIAAMAMSLKVYDPVMIHGFTLTAGQVEDVLALLMTTPLEERRRLPGVQPEPADIIVAGVRIVQLVMQNLGLTDLKVSEADIMYGLTLQEAQ